MTFLVHYKSPIHDQLLVQYLIWFQVENGVVICSSYITCSVDLTKSNCKTRSFISLSLDYGFVFSLTDNIVGVASDLKTTQSKTCYYCLVLSRKI